MKNSQHELFLLIEYKKQTIEIIDNTMSLSKLRKLLTVAQTLSDNKERPR